MSQHIRILQSFSSQSDNRLIATAGAVIQGLTGNTDFPNPPVDLKTVQAACDSLTVAIAAKPYGGLAATAHKNKERAQLIALLRRLSYYVQDACGGEAASVLKTGFAPISLARARQPLNKPTITRIDFGNTSQLVVRVNAVPRARTYEVRTAALGGDKVSGSWQAGGLFTNSRSMPVGGLSPGTTYSIQVRAIGGSTGYSDWSDPVAHICA